MDLTSALNPIAPDELTQKLLHQQKRELAILNAIIQTLSSSYNLKETLESALEIVLAVVESTAGWICLLDDQSCSAFVGSKGLCFADEACGPTPCLAHCVCGRVQATKDVVIVRKLAKGCPLLYTEESGGQQKITGHVSVPLTSKAHLVGQLNVAFSEQAQADQMDIDLLKAIAPQLAIAVENARLWEDVQDKEALRTRLLQRVVGVQEDERRRISRELHDELGQGLTSLLVRLQLLEKLDGHPDAHEIIAGLKESTTGMLASIHDMALELRPTILDDLGLVPALAQYVKACPQHLGIQVDFEVIGSNGLRLPREIETTLYRIVQESLTNVARHSGAQKASILLRFSGKKVAAIIEDNGTGFDLQDVRSRPPEMSRLGIFGMEERVALVGGQVNIETAPGAGTNIFVEIPVERTVEPLQE
jgi:signal transduction histidine kinase